MSESVMMMILRYQETLKSLGFSLEMNCDTFIEWKSKRNEIKRKKINNWLDENMQRSLSFSLSLSPPLVSR